jgi:hypothetical protein
MSIVFFSYFLQDGASGEEFEQRIMADVAPAARAHESVLDWRLHRTVPWPGSSDEGADYVSVAEVTGLPAWSADAAESIAHTHAKLRDLVRRITMTATDEVGD